jgi:hypothetical protein
MTCMCGQLTLLQEMPFGSLEMGTEHAGLWWWTVQIDVALLNEVHGVAGSA